MPNIPSPSFQIFRKITLKCLGNETIDSWHLHCKIFYALENKKKQDSFATPIIEEKRNDPGSFVVQWPLRIRFYSNRACKRLILSPNQSRSSWNAEEQWDSRLHRTPIQPIKNQHNQKNVGTSNSSRISTINICGNIQFIKNQQNQHMWEHPIHQEST